MARADLHVHSKYSEHPSEWFLQRLGANESYTEPEFIYQRAKERGMDFVTLTDHNRIDGALRLQEAHPDDVFLGLEATTYFPEDGCKIHLLVYGLTETEFDEIQRFRSDIYDLRAYVQSRNLAHAVAHATFSENHRLSLAHLERLILLFDHFEGINGSRNRLNNVGWMQALEALTPERLVRLQDTYRIAPISATPWIKTFTGGSDDHAGLLIGQTYTEAQGATPADFLRALKAKETQAGGRHNDFGTFAFTLYKIAYDFSQSKNQGQGSHGWLGLLHTLLFDSKALGFKNQFMLNTLKWRKPASQIHLRLKELIENLHSLKELKTLEKLPVVYQRLADISDEFFRALFMSLGKDLEQGDIAQVVMNVSASLPGLFLSLPFFSTLTHMHRDRELLNTLAETYGTADAFRPQKALWFCNSSEEAQLFPAEVPASPRFNLARDTAFKFAVVATEDEIAQGLPENIIPLPAIHTQALSARLRLRVPSLLKTLEKIEAYDPDVIYVSTPGPAGWLAVLAARLMKIKVIGVFGDDLAAHFRQTVPDEGAAELADAFLRSFYGLMHEIQVPSHRFREQLEERGYAAEKLRYVPRGIDTQRFAPRSHRSAYVHKKYWQHSTAPKWLYVRQPGDEKALEFVLSLVASLRPQAPGLRLLLMGTGPLPESARHHAYLSQVAVTDHDLRCDLYSSADLLLYPQASDPVGQIILEAQACGLPVMVAHQGAPSEIILPEQTGWQGRAWDHADWRRILTEVLALTADTETYAAVRRLARKHTLNTRDWENATRTPPTPLPASAFPRVPALV